MFQKILVPVDVHDAEVAREAIAAAVAIGKAFDAELRLIHVASPILPGSPVAVIPQELYEEIGVAEKAELETLAKSIDMPRVSSVVRIGGVYPELLAEAEEWPADLVIVGAHRRSMATYLLGSTATAMSRHSKCTVMIVRSPIKAKIL